MNTEKTVSARVSPMNASLEPSREEAAKVKMPDGPVLSAPKQRVRTHLWLCAFISIAWTIATVWAMEGGYKHFEVDNYLPYHLSSHTLLFKLFDSHVLDADCYSARELSYLFDDIDCHFIAACTRHGFPHFMSLTVLSFVVLLTLALWRFSMRDLRLGLPATCALTLMFLTTPFSMYSSAYFRNGKIGVSLLTVLSVMTMFRFFHREPPVARRHQLSSCLQLFVLSSLAMVFDRQGVFLTALGVCVVALLALRRNGGLRWLPLIPLLSALALNTLYTRILAPHIAWALHGYWPSMEFQSIPLQNIAAKPFLYLLAGSGITVETMAFTFGNLPDAYFIFAWLGVGWLMWNMGLQSPTKGPLLLGLLRRHSPLCIMAGTVFAILALNILMVCRHTPLIWPDVRRVYYWLPTSALWFMLAVVLVHQLQQANLVPRRVLAAALFILVIGNINALPYHRTIIREGHLKKDFLLSSKILTALRPNAPKDVPEDVEKDIIYQLLKNEKNVYNQPAAPLRAFEKGTWRVEVLAVETNRPQYAFKTSDGAPCASRGALIQATPAPLDRFGLAGPMRLTSADGKSYRFYPKPLARVPGNSQYFARIRVSNLAATNLSYRVGSFVLLSEAKPMKLVAVGADKWLFSKEQPEDLAGAKGVMRVVPGGASQEFVYVFDCDAAEPKLEVGLVEDTAAPAN